MKTKVVPNILASGNVNSLEDAMSVFEICLTFCKIKIESLKLVNSINISYDGYNIENVVFLIAVVWTKH